MSADPTVDGGPEEGGDGRVLRARALRDARRLQLLAAARRVFAERGYLGASISAIQAEASASRATFYLYFESKLACFGEVLAGFVERLRAAIAPVDLRAPTPAREQLMSNLVRVLGILEEDADLARMLLQQARGTDREIDLALDDLDRGVLALIVGSLGTGRRLGLVRLEERDVRLHASFVLGALKEAVSQTILAPPGRGVPLGQEEVAAALLDFTLRGVLRGPTTLGALG